MQTSIHKMSERTRQSDLFRAWYGHNADGYNANRRRRYKADPLAREAARQNAADYREKTPADYVPPMRNGMYGSTAVARSLGISTQTLRNWEAKKWIPHATHGGKHRLYTLDQVSLLQNLFEHSSDSKQFLEAQKLLFKHWDTQLS